eukprot:TRINITY_DN7898_c1_g1_i12.p1 TRINITY_DN7898_c1_g1~~TRINITY_DN7898_c1_g1_i12.p1  ORF type:complete len:419 (+),score=52.49 TRINITY_DN7898_c1_g1_i12:979-2235(+)
MSTERTSGITVILDGTNYAYWSHLMQNFLKGQKLWKYLVSKIDQPNPKNAKYEERESAIGKINSWIANSSIPSIGNQLAKFDYPKDAWDYLARLYTQTNAACRYQIEREIKNADQGNDSIHDFYVKMTSLWDQLALMEPQFKSTEDTKTFHTYRQETWLVQFLMARRSDFEHARGLLLHRSPLPTVDDGRSELLAEEQTWRSLNRKKLVENDQVLSTKATAQKTERSVPPGVTDVCNYCKEKGHWKFNYPIRPNRQNNKNNRSQHTQHFCGPPAPNQHMRPSATQQQYHPKPYAANTTEADGGTISASQIQSMIDERMQQLFLASSPTSCMAVSPFDLGSAMTMTGASGNKNSIWIFDSGASYRMTHDLSLLHKCHSPSVNLIIHTTNDTPLRVTTIGSISTKMLSPSSVLCVPNLVN